MRKNRITLRVPAYHLKVASAGIQSTITRWEISKSWTAGPSTSVFFRTRLGLEKDAVALDRLFPRVHETGYCEVSAN